MFAWNSIKASITTCTQVSNLFHNYASAFETYSTVLAVSRNRTMPMSGAQEMELESGGVNAINMKAP